MFFYECKNDKKLKIFNDLNIIDYDRNELITNVK